MFVLALSVLLTTYVVIPEAIFRFVFGIYVPTRNFVLTGTETAFRAVLVAFLPFWLAFGLSWYAPGPSSWPFPVPVEQNSAQQRRMDYKTVASALYSDVEFTKSQTQFWPAFTRSSRRQSRLVFWYFILIGVEAWVSGLFVSKYPKFKENPAYKWLSDRILSPYISQWHPLLKLPDTKVQADILCTNDTLYQGVVSEHFLKDGELSGIILAEPRRFNRDLYLKAKAEAERPKTKDFWVPIPSQHLYFFADKILNINLSYLTTSDEIGDSTAVEKFLSAEFSPRAKDLGKLTVSLKEQKPSSAQQSMKTDDTGKQSK